MLGEANGLLCEFDVNLGDAFLACGIEFRAMTPKTLDRLIQEPFARSSQILGFVGLGIGFDGLPQLLVQRQRGVEGTDLGLHGIVGRAQRRSGRDRFQVPDDPHAEVQGLGQLVEDLHRVLEGPGARGRC